ncbi:hypothetical protein F4680DRAFT_417907 [Xylaria scruposa]|nr:hypothetical protein F4680DRAFT_417907 [Xylaria scruposa]
MYVWLLNQLLSLTSTLQFTLLAVSESNIITQRKPSSTLHSCLEDLASLDAVLAITLVGLVGQFVTRHQISRDATLIIPS